MSCQNLTVSAEPITLKVVVDCSEIQVQSEPIDLVVGFPTASPGEANTATNIGGAAEVFAQKVGANLEFRTIESLTSEIVVTQQLQTIQLDFNPTPTPPGDGVLRQFKDADILGARNGINLVFTFPFAVVASGLRLYRNGLRLQEDSGGGADYQINGGGGLATGFTVSTSAPLDSEEFEADYNE